MDKELKNKILCHLWHGHENALRKKNLSRLCNCNERALRKAIRELIDEGHPICGSPHRPYGYFIADNQEEIKKELEMLRHYGKELFRRYATIRKMKASFVLQHPGQLSLKF